MRSSMISRISPGMFAVARHGFRVNFLRGLGSEDLFTGEDELCSTVQRSAAGWSIAEKSQTWEHGRVMKKKAPSLLRPAALAGAAATAGAAAAGGTRTAGQGRAGAAAPAGAA